MPGGRQGAEQANSGHLGFTSLLRPLARASSHSGHFQTPVTPILSGVIINLKSILTTGASGYAFDLRKTMVAE